VFDGLFGGGYTTSSITLNSGNVNLTNAPSSQIQSDQTGAQTAGTYNKVSFNISRAQTIDDLTTLYASLTTQTSNKNLDSSEKIYLGGATAVRAYPVGEGAGTTGTLMNLELRRKLDPQTTLTGFYDWGSANTYTNNLRGDGTGPISSNNQFSLMGYGASITWTGAGFDVKGTLARRISTNPLADTNGNDTNGTLVINRFWLNVGKSF
jgi:hemolysin activation/secretion protein